MLQVSITQLVAAIQEATPFTQPVMDAGVSYLYDRLYLRLSRGEEVTLSSINFDSFELEDIDSLNDLYTGTFEQNSYTACGIMSTLHNAAPVCKAVGFV